MYQRVVFGRVTKEENRNLPDLTWREKVILVPLVVLIFWIGIYPKPFFDRIEPAVRDVLSRVNEAALARSGTTDPWKGDLFIDDAEVVEAPYGETEVTR
jgi:NADH:ubiquinone oxidoreductase subunit 4 (subunit M)